MKISQAESHTLFPKPLLNADVPTEIFFRLQIWVVAKDFVLTAGRTESSRHTRVQRCIGLVDLITASDAIRPDAAELVEVIEAPAGHEDQIFDRGKRRLRETCDLIGVIANERGTKQYKRAFLTCVNAAVKKTRGQRKPRRWSQIVLIINLRTFEQRARWADESVLVRIVDLPLVIVIENEFVLPPVRRSPIDVRTYQPTFGEEVIDGSWVENRVRISGVAH